MLRNLSKQNTILYVAGCAPNNSGYPNAANTLRYLSIQNWLVVKDFCYWLPESTKLWSQGTGNIFGSIKTAVFLLIFSAISAFAVSIKSIFDRKSVNAVYVPYPSIFALLFFRLIPKPLRPRLIADFYISIFDSAFRDRDFGFGKILRKLVMGLEKYAIRTADLALVDTEANRDEMIGLFGLRPDRVQSVPLSINEDAFEATACAPRPQSISRKPALLFVGNLAPLHGIECILDAVVLARKNADFEFFLVGDGQESPTVERFLREKTNFEITWIRRWQSQKDIAALILHSDVCLGVFGKSEKAQRVFPFKNYLYLCAGRPVITQGRFSLPSGTGSPPIICCENDPEALSDAICRLLLNAEKREEIGAESRYFYRTQLGHGRLMSIWKGIIESDHDFRSGGLSQ